MRSESIDFLDVLWRSHRSGSAVSLRVLGGGRDKAVTSKLMIDPSMIIEPGYETRILIMHPSGWSRGRGQKTPQERMPQGYSETGSLSALVKVNAHRFGGRRENATLKLGEHISVNGMKPIADMKRWPPEADPSPRSLCHSDVGVCKTNSDNMWQITGASGTCQFMFTAFEMTWSLGYIRLACIWP